VNELNGKLNTSWQETIMLKRAAPFVIEGYDGIWIGREMGRELQAEVIARLESLPKDSVLPLDFAAVRAINFSFADELVAKIARRIAAGEPGRRFIVLCNVGEGPQEDLTAALKARDSVCVLEENDGRRTILGDISPEMRSTYDFAVENGRVTARDLIEQKEKTMSIAASSNRLARLRDMALLVPVESETVAAGGRQNIFVPVG
jgi:hypothetical protein